MLMSTISVPLNGALALAPAIKGLYYLRGNNNNNDNKHQSFK